MIRDGLVMLGLALLAQTPGHAADAADPSNPALAMAEAAAAFLATLPPDKRERAQLPFHSEERLNWHFVPRPRQGLPLKQMSPEERQAALALLKVSLSAAGLRKVDTIRSLEAVLREIENEPRRDAELYYFTVFGEASDKGAWGWRYEGHHTSLHWTLVDGQVAGSSPQFMGANPADVRVGPRTGTRALAAEEDLGRALVSSLSADQRELAVVSASAPFGPGAPLGIVTGTSREAAMQEDNGIAYSQLDDGQKGLLLSLIQEYATTQPPAVAEVRLGRVKQELASLKFAWMGGLEKGQGHYYRIQGPSFLIEYDNTQGDANHIHSVWREFQGDWGKDVLSEHYRTAPHHADQRGTKP
jgi:hypothetical protein